MSVFEKGCKSIATRYAQETGHGDESASSLDWISLAMEIGSVLIPVIKECLEKRRSAKGVAEFAKKRQFFTRLRIRQALNEHSEFRMVRDKTVAVNAIMSEITERSEADLTSALQEVADEA